MVLSTALFDKPAFKNLVCNGLVLAGDGKKMSKRLKNYPVSANYPVGVDIGMQTHRGTPVRILHNTLSWAHPTHHKHSRIPSSLDIPGGGI